MTPGPRIKQRNNRTSATVGGGIKPTDDIPVSFRYERLIIAGLCLAVAIRVFAFSAAFPFFNNVDEVAHFDLVFKYSRGHLPAAPLEKYDPVAAEIIANSAQGDFLDIQVDKSPDMLAQALLSDKQRQSVRHGSAGILLPGGAVVPIRRIADDDRHRITLLDSFS